MTLETKLDQILERLDVIESSLGIKKPSLWDNLKPLYNVTDTAKLLGCSVSKVRKYLKFGMLESVSLGHRKMVSSKSIEKLYKDNDERAIFFVKGVIETIKKLNWAPDLIHVHGWIASLLPIYLKNFYDEEPMFENTKVIVSLYEKEIKGKLDKRIVDKLKFDQIDDKNLKILENHTYESLYKISLALSDGVIFTDDIRKNFNDILKKIKIPILECFLKEGYEEEYLEFYNKFFVNEDK